MTWFVLSLLIDTASNFSVISWLPEMAEESLERYNKMIYETPDHEYSWCLKTLPFELCMWVGTHVSGYHR